MRILITTSLFPPDIGGPATYVPRIAAYLAQQGHAISVVAPQTKGQPCPIEDPPYRLLRFEHAHVLRFLNYFIELWRAFRSILVEARQCDLIYINGLDLAAAMVCIYLRKPSIVKVVGDGAWELAHSRGWTKLDLEDFQKAHSARFWLLRRMRHAAARRARAVIVPSRYQVGIVANWGIPPECIHIVYNAIHPPAVQPPPPIPSQVTSSFCMVMIGRMIPLKRMDAIIQTLHKLENTSLIIIGSGPQQTRLISLVKQLGLEKRVYFTGQLENSQVWGIMKSYAKAVILYSVHETFPHVLVEAAACGVPVIATAVGGSPEIVINGKTGILIPPDDIDAFKAAVQRLQNDTAFARQLSKNAIQSAERFSVEKMASETEAILTGVVQ